MEQRTHQGANHLAMRVEGAPPASWAHGGPPPLIPAPTHSFSLPKNHYTAQARVLARFAAIFDLLAQSSIQKTALGDCCLVTLFLSLHVKFMRSQVILMHDRGSRHLWE